MNKKQYIRLQTQIEDLRAQLEIEKRNLHEGLKQGDLRENADVDNAKLNIAVLQKQIEQKQELLQNAIIDDKPSKKVTFKLDEKEVMTKSIESGNTADYRSTISEESIVGKLLNKAKVGDIISYEDNIGSTHKIEVLRVI